MMRLLSIGLLAFLMISTPAQAAEILVFAASSTTNALQDAASAFTKATGITVKTSFAGSSKLAKQIVAGAPADIYISANPLWMDYLQTNGEVEPGTRHPLLSNRLVIVQPDNEAPLLTLKTLPQAIKGDRLALGDPAHVPAGIYAKQALTHLGLWESVKDRIVAMPNVRTTLALVSRGEVAAGVVYATDALISPKLRIAHRFAATDHSPIRYPVAIIKHHDTPEVRAFYDYLLSPQAAALFTTRGFSVSNDKETTGGVN